MVTDGLGEIEDEDGDDGLDEHPHIDFCEYWFAPPEAAAIVQAVRHEHHSPRLDGCPIRVLLTLKPLRVRGNEAAAICQKANPILRDLLGGVLVFIVIRQSVWNRFVNGEMSEQQMQRLADHELCHIEWDGEKERVTLREPPHEFPEIIERWGADPLDPLTRAIAKQLRLGLELS